MPANEITCPVCMETVKLPKPATPGMTLRCPHCRAGMLIPEDGGDPVPASITAGAPQRPATKKPSQPPAPPAPQAVKPVPRPAPKPAAKTAPSKPGPKAQVAKPAANAFADLGSDDDKTEPKPRKKSGGCGPVVAIVLVVGLLFVLGGGGAVAVVIVLGAGWNQLAAVSSANISPSNPSGIATPGPKENTPVEGPPVAEGPLDALAQNSLKKATVVIRAPLGKDGADVVRTGFFAADKGMIATTAKGLTGNVGLGAPAFEILVNPGQPDAHPVIANRVDVAQDYGLMLLRVRAQDNKPGKVADPLTIDGPPPLKVGQKVYTICRPERAEEPFGIVTLDVASVKNGKTPGTSEVQVQGTLPATAAGAPIVDARGRLIGLVPVVGAGPMTVVTGQSLPTTVAALVKANPPDMTPDPPANTPPKPSPALTMTEVRKFEGHKGIIYSLAVSRDGKTVVSGGDDLMGRLWSVETGKQTAMLEGHTQTIRGVDLSPDGLWVLSGGEDMNVFLWDAMTGKQIQTLTPAAGGNNDKLRKVETVGFSRDGHYLLSIDDMAIHVWEEGVVKDTFTEVSRLSVPGLKSLALLPEPRAVVVSGGTIASWQLGPNTMAEQLVKFPPTASVALAVANKGDVLLTTHSRVDKPLVLWDARTGTKLRDFGIKDAEYYSAAFTWDDRQLVTADMDGILRLWNVETGEELGHWKAHQNIARVVRMMPDGNSLISAGDDSLMKLWNLSESKMVAVKPPDKPMVGEVRKLAQHKGSVLTLAFSPKGDHLISGGDDKTVQLWETATGKPIRTLMGHKGAVTGVAFSGDGLGAFSGALETGLSQVRVWEVASGKEAPPSQVGHNGGINALVMTRGSKFLATAGNDQFLRMWNMGNGQSLKQFNPKTAITALALSHDAAVAASAGADKAVRLWNVNDGTELKKITSAGSVHGLAFSPDGKFLATAGLDKVARTFDTIEGTEKMKFEGHTEPVLSVDVSTDGKRLVTGSRDKTVRVWDIASGKELHKFEGHTDIVRCVRFSPDGTLVGSASNDGTVRLWAVAK